MVKAQFCDLTNELLFAVFQRCDTVSDVLSLARTSRTLYAIFAESPSAICTPIQQRRIPAYEQALSYAQCREQAERRRARHVRAGTPWYVPYIVRTLQETSKDFHGICNFFETRTRLSGVRSEHNHPEQYLQWDRECFSYLFFLCLELATEKRLHPSPNHARSVLRDMRMRELLGLQYLCYWLRKEEIFADYSLDAPDYPMLVIGEFSSAWRMTDIAMKDRRRRLGASAPDTPALCVCMEGQYRGLASWQARVHEWASLEMMGECPACSPESEECQLRHAMSRLHTHD